MRLLRRRTELGYLALFALAVQLALSFSHVHGAWASRENAPLACRTFYQPAADHGCPLNKTDHKGCAVCWTISLAGSALFATPPVLALPAPVSDPCRPDLGRDAAPRAMTAACEARGPPASV
jgi:hypothetical protein